MIQMLDPHRSVGFIKKMLAFLVEKQKKEKGAFSIIRCRNLRGLDHVCIYANFCDKNVVLNMRKTVRGRIDANPASEEKRKMKNENSSKASRDILL